MFDQQMAVFKVHVHCHWTGGAYSVLQDNRGGAALAGDDEEEDEEDDD